MTNGLISHSNRNNALASPDIQWNELLLVLLLLCFSGNPAAIRQPAIDYLLVGFAVFLAAMLVYRRQRVVISAFGIIASLFFAILMIQVVSFSFLPVVTIAGFFTRLFIGYVVIRLVGDFPCVYVRAMVLLAIMSLVFHIPYLLLATAGISTEGLIDSLSAFLHTSDFHIRWRPLFLHNFYNGYSHRNSGLFWEPGAFAGYLVLAMVFVSMIKEKLSRRTYQCYLVILSVVLFTTLSTTGYLVYPLVLLLQYEWKAKIRKKTNARIMLALYVVLPLIIGGSFVAYNELPFLREKIETQTDSIAFEKTGWHRHRLGSIIFDWEYIQRRPLTGWGLHGSTRYALHPHFKFEEISGMGNGMSNFTAKFGITGMMIWLFFVFLRMIRLTKRDVGKSLLIMVILLLVLQGECYLGHPLFLGLMFLEAGSSGKSEFCLALPDGHKCRYLTSQGSESHRNRF